MRFFVWAAACLTAFSALAQPAENQIKARQLLEWQNGDGKSRQRFECYILLTYKALRESKVICPPDGRTEVANENAALEAARMGVDEGLFDGDISAKDAVTDALAFWYPCKPRK